jgi:hypothetical protein
MYDTKTKNLLFSSVSSAIKNFTLKETNTKGTPQLVHRLGYGLDVQGFNSQEEQQISLFSKESRSALGPTQHLHCIPGTLSPGPRQQRCEGNHSPPSSAEAKNTWRCTSTRVMGMNYWSMHQKKEVEHAG